MVQTLSVRMAREIGRIARESGKRPIQMRFVGPTSAPARASVRVPNQLVAEGYKPGTEVPGPGNGAGARSGALQPDANMANAAASTATTIPAVRPLPLVVAFIDRTLRSPDRSRGKAAHRLKMLTPVRAAVKRISQLGVRDSKNSLEPAARTPAALVVRAATRRSRNRVRSTVFGRVQRYSSESWYIGVPADVGWESL